MFRALSVLGSPNSDGFMDHSDFVKLQTTKFTKQYANPYPASDYFPVSGQSLPLNKGLSLKQYDDKGFVKNDFSAAAGLGTYDPNTRQTSTRDIDIANYVTTVGISEEMRSQYNKCLNAGKNGLSGLETLANTTNYNSRFRCGWIYKKGNPGDQPEVSTGYIGTKHGPATMFGDVIPKGRWFWNLEDAKKAILADRCTALKTCDDVGRENYARCAFSTSRGIGIPIDSKGRVLYPKDAMLSAPQKSLIIDPIKCPRPPPVGSPQYEVARSLDICLPREDGTLSRDCMLNQIEVAGCKREGLLHKAFSQATNPKNYTESLNHSLAMGIYQNRMGMNALQDSVIRDGSTTKWNALDNFKKINSTAKEQPDTGLGYAARDLCEKSGLIAEFDFCTEIKDDERGPFSVDCIQKAWRQAGGQPAGTGYYGPKTVAKWDNYFNGTRTWKNYKDDLIKIANMCRSTDEIEQRDALLYFLGIKREPSLTDQIGRINGTEVLWFNRQTNCFWGRRVNTDDARFPNFSTGGEVEGTGLSDFVEFYTIANIRPPNTIDVKMRLETDDGSVYVLNKDIDGQKTRGYGLFDNSAPYAKIPTASFGANWDQAPTQYTSSKVWRLRANGPNYVVGFWQETGGYAHSKIFYSPMNEQSFNEIPASWSTLTQEPDAPMFSWESWESYASDMNIFAERRFPSMMELQLSSPASIIDTPKNSPMASIFPACVRIKNNGNGYAVVKRPIRMQAWRTITLMFLAKESTVSGIPSDCGMLGYPDSDNRIRLYNQDDCNTIGGNWYGNGECIKKGGGSWSWDCRDLNTNAGATILQFGPISVQVNKKDVLVKWNSATLKAEGVFSRSISTDGITPNYLMINMRSQFKNQYPDTVSMYVGTKPKFSNLNTMDIKSFSTPKNDPIYSPSDCANLYIGDKKSLNSADIMVGALRLFDYEMSIEDIQRDMANDWKMKYMKL